MNDNTNDNSILMYLHSLINSNGVIHNRKEFYASLLKIKDKNLLAQIKSCILSDDPGWIMVGADFSSLEDRISALTTKDPNKLKVYTEGYDGHCLRAFYYFKDQMPDIEDTLESINSIENKYKHLRQASKTPTFALTYAGTAYTIEQQGFTPEQAKQIETNYHELYKVSDQWVANQIEQATYVGYVTCAFGLRVRTPILSQTVIGSKTPYEAKSEARTAGNALGQSYGLLNNRAAIELQQRVLNSKYKYDIRPMVHIHDSQYFLIRNTYGCVEWFNRNLIECMCWNELPELQHDIVKINAEMDINYPNWSYSIKVPINATKQQLKEIVYER